MLLTRGSDTFRTPPGRRHEAIWLTILLLWCPESSAYERAVSNIFALTDLLSSSRPDCATNVVRLRSRVFPSKNSSNTLPPKAEVLAKHKQDSITIVGVPLR